MTVSSMAPDVYSFACTACGKCCNSPPQMSLPELFHHREIFIGCLAIKRFRLVTGGAKASLGARNYRFGDEDRAAFAGLYGSLLFKAPAPGHHGEYIALFTQAFDYPSLRRCPALAEDQHCSIHDDGLPTQCAAVPMDPLVPDHLQHVVLASRSTAENFIGADCIVEGERDGFARLTRNREIAAVPFRDAVYKRRAELAADRAWWGNAVFAALRRDLFDSAASHARIPFDGFFQVSLVPVLARIASLSDHAREGCLVYLEVQLRLIEDTVKRAIARNMASDKPATHQLRAWAKSYRVLQKTLTAAKSAAAENPELRTWLGWS